MADPKGGKPAPKKGASKVYKKYTVAGGKLERKNKTCPKCGPSVFMAAHADRLSCGKCKYMEMKRKS